MLAKARLKKIRQNSFHLKLSHFFWNKILCSSIHEALNNSLIILLPIRILNTFFSRCIYLSYFPQCIIPLFKSVFLLLQYNCSSSERKGFSLSYKSHRRFEGRTPKNSRVSSYESVLKAFILSERR